MIRSLPAAALALVASACEPDLPQSPPGAVVTAVFDPTTAQIPLPNDLAFINAPNSVCLGMHAATDPPACAQAELLTLFNRRFPGDQEVPITIQFTRTDVANGQSTTSTPDLDLTTLTPSTFFVFGAVTGGQVGEVPIDPPTYANGTLTIHHQGHAPWAPGSYVVGLRGGADGVKATDKTPVSPSLIFTLLAADVDLADPKNQGLLKASNMGSADLAAAQGAQLEQLRVLYDAGVFPTVDAHFPHHDLAVATSFSVAPAQTNVVVDSGRGIVPLPIDLLRDGTGHLSQLAACTLSSQSLNADGTCTAPAAAGFLALDGFSTTGPILAQTSELIQASTINPTTVMLFELPKGGAPTPVSPVGLLFEPCEVTSSCTDPANALSPAIVIQPASASKGEIYQLVNPATAPTAAQGTVFRTKPLKDDTDYAVVMTNDIRDKAGQRLVPGTVAQILRFKNQLAVDHKSQLSGIDDATADALETMRLQLQPVFLALAAGGTDASKVAMAFTFHTQSILAQAVGLAALPYANPAAFPLPGEVHALSADDAFIKYGVPAAVPHSNIKEVLETDITTFNALDPATGAFYADLASAGHVVPETIHVLIATPNTTPTTCAGQQVGCAPLMVFRHGLGRGRVDMLAIADSFAAKGMVTVAIDAAKHGDRTWCTTGLPAGGLPGQNGCVAECVAIPNGAGQGDANPPGTCDASGLVKKGFAGTDLAAGQDGIAVQSGLNYFISANFFRTRDSMRQDITDESQLIRTMAPIDATVTMMSPLFQHMAPQGIIIDATRVYFTGQSLGAIQGAMDVAANQRISKAAFNVGGGTMVDVFTNSTDPAFVTTVQQLLAGLHISPGTSAFLQFLAVGKTVLDPADPINYLGHLTDPNHTLATFDGTALQGAKSVLAQLANCDGVIPNPFGFLYASNVPTSPLPPSGAPAAAGAPAFQEFASTAAATASCPGGGAVPHGFLLDWTSARAATAQSDIATFMTSGTNPPSIRQQ